MTEQEFRISLGAYVLGALEPGETKDVETHLRTCAGCQLEYLELAETLGALGSVPPDITAAGLDGRPASYRPNRYAARADGPGPADAGQSDAGQSRPGPNGPDPATPGRAGPGPTGDRRRFDRRAPDTAHGPAPAGAELAQRRLARSARTTRRATWLAAVAVATAAAVVAAVAVSVVVRTGRPGGGEPSPRALSPTAGSAAPANHTVSAVSPSTGVAVIVTLRSQPGGTQVDALVTGKLQPGWKCQMVVWSVGGTPEAGGSMMVTRPTDGIRLESPVSLPMEQISRIEIQRAGGQPLVSVTL